MGISSGEREAENDQLGPRCADKQGSRNGRLRLSFRFSLYGRPNNRFTEISVVTRISTVRGKPTRRKSRVR